MAELLQPTSTQIRDIIGLPESLLKLGPVHSIIETSSVLDLGPTADVMLSLDDTADKIFARKDLDVLGNVLQFTERALPANPPANQGKLYVRDVATVTTLFFLDSAGTETDLLAGGGGGEANTISSLGGGTVLTAAVPKAGVDLRTVSIATTAPITHSVATDLLTFDINDLVNADISATAAIVLTKLQNIATDRLLGRETAASGAIEEISLNATLELVTATTLQRAALTGDITATAGSNTTAIATGVIVDADINASAGIVTTKLADSTNFVLTNRANTYGAFAQRFPTTQLQLDNPAGTFQYIFATSAIITADKIVTLPLLTANDTFVFNTFAATLANKTLTTPTIASFVNATHSHLNAAGGGTITKAAISDFAHQADHQSGGSDALTGNLDATARTSVSKNSAADVGARRTLNFIEGANVTLTIVDDSGGEEVDITIASTAGGGSPLTTKGDIFGFDTADNRIPVGTNEQVLMADSVQALGVKYALVADANIVAHTSTKITITAKGQLNSAIVYTDQINTFGDFVQTFKDNALHLENPAGTFDVVFQTSAEITSDRILTIPLLGANRTMVVTGLASQIVIGTEVTGASTALTDTADIAYLNQANTFGAFLNSFAGSTMRIPLSATPTMAVDGDFAIDTTITDFSMGLIKYFDGEEMAVIAVPIAELTTPADGDVVSYNATNDEFELVPQTGGAGEANTISSLGGGTVLTAAVPKSGVDLRTVSIATTAPITHSVTTDLLTFDINDLVNADISATAAIALSKLQNIATDRLLGRETAASGAIEEISLNATLELVTATTLQRAALTGDVTAPAGSNATTVASVPDGALSANVVLETIANTYGAFLQDFALATMRIPVSATPTIAVNGDIGIDTTITDFTTPLIRYFGTESMVVVAVPDAQIVTPTGGHVITYNATTDEFELIAAAGGSDTPWTVNHDAAGFNLTDVGLLQTDTVEVINAGAGTNPTLTSNSATNNLLLVNDQLEINNVGAGANPIFLSNDAGQILDLTGGLDVSGALTLGTALAIAEGGTSQITRQAAIDTLTDVAAATNEHVLTKDTATGNAIFKAAGAASQTPWTQDIDADGFDLFDLSNILFRTTTGAPTATDRSIHYEDTEGMVFNALTGDVYRFEINGVLEAQLSATALDLQNNNLILGTGIISFSAAGQQIDSEAAGMNLKIPAGDVFNFLVAGSQSLTIRSTGIDLVGLNIINIGGVADASAGGIRMANAIAVNWRNAGNTANFGITGNTSDEIEIAAGTNLKLIASGALGLVTMGELTTPATPAANTGSFYVKDVGTVSTAFFIGDDGVEKNITTGVGDDLGDHTATQDLSINTNAITFGTDAAPPVSTVQYINADVNGIILNVPTGDDFSFKFNFVDKVVIDANNLRLTDLELRMSDNEQISWGGSNQRIIKNSATGMLYGVLSGDSHTFEVAAGTKVKIDASFLDIRGLSLISVGSTTDASVGGIRLGNVIAINWRNAGNTADFGITGNASDQIAIDTTVTLSAGSNILMGASGALGFIEMGALTTPATPANGFGRYYTKEVATITTPFFIGDDGVEIDLTAGGGSQTPWTSDIDAASFDLRDVSNIEFVDPSTGNPGPTINAIYVEAAGMVFNVPTTNNFAWSVNDVNQMTIDVTTLSLEGNTITNVGAITQSVNGDITMLDGFLEMGNIAVPADPPATKGRFFVNSANADHASYKRGSTVIDLETGAEVTTWTADHDTGGFSLLLTDDATPPAGTITAIYAEAGELNFNVASGNSHLFTVNATTTLTITSSSVEVGSNVLQFGQANQDIRGNASGLEYDTPVGDTHEFFIAAASEMTLSATALTLAVGNNILMSASAGLGYIEMGALTTPLTPANGFGRYYVKEVATITTPFFIGDDGTEIDLTAGGGATSFIGFTADANLVMADFDITAKPTPNTDFFEMLVEIIAGDDAGTEPMFHINLRRDTPAAVVTRNLFEISNNDVAQLVVTAAGNLALQGNNLLMGTDSGEIQFQTVNVNIKGVSDDLDYEVGLNGVHIFRENGAARMQIDGGGVTIPANNRLTVDSNSGEAGYRDIGNATDPTTVTLDGDLYYNNSSKKYRFFDGTVWADVGVGAGQTPWAQDIDAAGFDLFNIGSTTSSSIGGLRLGNNIDIGWRNAANTGDAVFRVFTTDSFEMIAANDAGTALRLSRSAAAPSGTLGFLGFFGKTLTGGVLVEYAGIRGDVANNSDTVREGELRFNVQVAGATVSFMHMNDAESGLTEFKRDIQMTSANIIMGTNILQFVDANTSITAVTNDLEYDVATANEHRWRVANANEMILTATALAMQANNITGLSILEFTNDTTHQILDTATLMRLAVGSGDTFEWTIAGTIELTLSPTAFNLPNAVFQENAIPISPIGLHEIPFDAGNMRPTATSGASAITDEEIGSAGNQKQVGYIEFADAATNNVTLKLPLPNNYNNGTIQIRLYWYAPTGATGNVRWEVKGVALGNSDLISTAYGTPIAYTDTGVATALDIVVGGLSGAVTLGNTPADNDFIFINLARLGGDGADTLADVVRLAGGKVQVTLDAAVAT